MSLLARWRADELTFSDTAGTTPCANGDGVASWGIFEGSQASNLATQATSGNRPTWNSDDGGYPSLSVVGSSVQRLALAHSAPWVLTQLSWVAAVKFTFGAGQRHLWGRSTSWGNAGCFADGTGIAGAQRDLINFHTSIQNRSCALTASSPLETNWFVIGGTANADKIELSINRQSAVRAAKSLAINFGTGPLTLFGDGSTNSVYHMTGAAREFAFWETAITQQEMETEIDAAMTRWGITNTIAVTPSTGTTGFTGIRGISRRIGT